jgi:DNA-binding SARP family transcriptional activator/pimeloyl-ACP methyl ester carboxylesterase
MTGNARLEIRLIGELAVVKDGAPVSLPGSRKTRALLAYLILNSGPHRRTRLCDIFWQVPDNPRGALRWSLTKLRRLVDGDDIKRIVADRETVAFEPTGVDIDLLRLREAMKEDAGKLDTEFLKEFVATASQGLLPGLDLSGQPEFDHFLSAEREAFRILHRDQLLELLNRLEDSPAASIQWLQRLVEIEPYSLQAHYALIDALARVGRKSDADRQLDSSLTMLKDVEDADLTVLRRAAAGKPSLTERVVIATEQPAKPQLDQQIRFCRSTDGTQIAYATVGSGPPLVKTANWLNHLDFDWESPVWRHIFHGMSDGRSLIRYDARGNGLSDWDVEDFSMERQVEDLEAVIDAIGIEQFPLLGLSQGCAISVEYAARHPEKVSRLILLGGYAKGWKCGGNPEVIRQTQAMMTLVGIGWGKDNPAFRQMFTSMFMPDAPPENQAWFNELQRITTTGQNAIKLLRATGNVDITDMLGDIGVPTLVLHSRGDMRVSFDQGRELAAGIPGARFVSLNSRNHLPDEADPAWPVLLREINDFLAE